MLLNLCGVFVHGVIKKKKPSFSLIKIFPFVIGRVEVKVAGTTRRGKLEKISKCITFEFL